MFCLFKAQAFFFLFKPKPEPSPGLDLPLAQVWCMWHGQITGQENSFSWTVWNRPRGIRHELERWVQEADQTTVKHGFTSKTQNTSSRNNRKPSSLLRLYSGLLLSVPWYVWYHPSVTYSEAGILLLLSSELFSRSPDPMTSSEARSLLEGEMGSG